VTWSTLGSSWGCKDLQELGCSNPHAGARY
jgi:hypothetical protein